MADAVKIARKWNYLTHSYEPVEVPKKATAYLANMDEVVQCAQCGKEMTFGDGYTSQEIHTAMGFGYSVCTICHTAELGRKIASKFEDE